MVIVDHSVYVKSGNEILRLCHNELEKNANADLVILDIRDRKSLFQLKKLILNGYVISVYIDGNIGVKNITGNNFDKSFTPIDFFNNIVYVKNGIGYTIYVRSY